MPLRGFGVMFLTWATLLVSLRAQTVIPKQELILPIVVNGQLDSNRFFQSTMHFLTTDSPGEVSRRGRDNNGGPLNVACLLAASSAAGDFTGVPGIPLFWSFRICPVLFNPPLESGWIQFTVLNSPPARINLELLLQERSAAGNRIVSATSIPAVAPAKGFLAPALSTTENSSAYAIVNPSETETANLTLKVETIGPNTKGLVCQRALSILPHTRVSKFLDELVTNCQLPEDSRRGTLTITSDIPIAVGALNVFFPEGKFVNLPVEAQ